MDFNQLDESIKKQYHEEILDFANRIGGKNAFLQMIEDIKEEKPNPLLNKSGTFHTAKVKVTLSKSIFKDTLTLLTNAMRREERTGDMLNGVNPQEYKSVMNMMRTLGPVNVSIIGKDCEDKDGFTFEVLDSSQEKKTKVSFMFKVIFFYHIDEAKKALSYEAK